MGNESSSPGVFHIPETDNLVKTIVLGHGESFTAITQRLCPAEGDNLIPQFGVDVRRGKVELKRQTAYRELHVLSCANFLKVQYWLSDLSGNKECV